MSYKKSKARKEFEVTSNELISMAKQVSYKRANLSYEHKNMIFQSSIVLLCSSLEEYLRLFIENLFFSYKTNKAKLSEIPQNLRTFALFQKQKTIFENYIYARDEVKTLEKLKVSNKDLYSVIDDDIILLNQIDSKIVVNDRKYPSPKNLKILYNRLGVNNIFNETNKTGKKNYEFQLRSFLDIRETIAHQESTDLTIDDIKRNFENIRDFLDKLDRVSYKYVCRYSGHKFWL